VISEDTIMGHLDMLLTGSEAGATLHHMHVIAAPRGQVGPFGVPDESQLHTTVYAIDVAAPDKDGKFNVEEFIAKVVMAAAVDANKAGRLVVFAALSQEVWIVERDHNDAHAQQLMQEGHLDEHPAAVEVTVVYGACRDGRRWRGQRWLTGPKAGSTEHVDLLVGAPRPGEAFGMDRTASLLRRLVGGRA
jgi:hypothetical protein